MNKNAKISAVVPPKTNLIRAKLDSGATNHYFREENKII